jgi:hypothetical protein
MLALLTAACEGPEGPMGPQGPAGETTVIEGSQGRAGPRGPEGIQGRTGPAGTAEITFIEFRLVDLAYERSGVTLEDNRIQADRYLGIYLRAKGLPNDLDMVVPLDWMFLAAHTLAGHGEALPSIMILDGAMVIVDPDNVFIPGLFAFAIGLLASTGLQGIEFVLALAVAV